MYDELDKLVIICYKDESSVTRKNQYNERTTVKKLIISICSIIAYATCVASDESEVSGWTPSVTVESLVVDKYLDRSGAVFYDASAIQTGIGVSFENGLYLDFWNSAPTHMSEWNENFGSEIDMSLGWAGKLEAVGARGWLGTLDVDLAVIFWDEPDLAVFGADDVFNFSVRVGKDLPYDSTGTNVVQLALEYVHSWVLPGSSYEGGSTIALELSKSHSFCNEHVIADASIYVMYDSGRFGGDNGFVLGGSVGLEWPITEHFSLYIPRILWTTPLTVDDDRELTASVSAGVGFSF